MLSRISQMGASHIASKFIVLSQPQQQKAIHTPRFWTQDISRSS
jgi:hypothetical protein